MWISTHMVHERMETRIDQSNINIWFTILKITKIISLQHGEESCYCVCHFAFALLLLFTCCSPVVQQGCWPFVHSFVVKAC